MLALLVCKHFGLDVKSYNYLASYNVTAEKIMQHLEAIATASKQILEFFSFSDCSIPETNCLKKLNLYNDYTF